MAVESVDHAFGSELYEHVQNITVPYGSNKHIKVFENKQRQAMRS